MTRILLSHDSSYWISSILLNVFLSFLIFRSALTTKLSVVFKKSEWAVMFRRLVVSRVIWELGLRYTSRPCGEAAAIITLSSIIFSFWIGTPLNYHRLFLICSFFPLCLVFLVCSHAYFFFCSSWISLVFSSMGKLLVRNYRFCFCYFHEPCVAHQSHFRYAPGSFFLFSYTYGSFSTLKYQMFSVLCLEFIFILICSPVYPFDIACSRFGEIFSSRLYVYLFSIN